MTIKKSIKAFLYNILPEDLYLKTIYRYYYKERLNLDHPERLSEKIFWLKQYNKNHTKELMQSIYDKYRVRDYVVSKIGDGYLPKLYGVYDNADEIDFDILPQKYVIKITQSCGFNFINDGNVTLQKEEIIERIARWQRLANDTRKMKKIMCEESYYYDGNAKIICEEYLEDSNGKQGMDIDFWCANGKPLFYEIFYDFIVGGKKNENCYKNAFDMAGNYIPVNIGRKSNASLKRIDYPGFDSMVEIAKKLSSDFPFMRVDIYNIDGRIVIGELTPIPMGGVSVITPIEYDYKWGKELTLPD